MANDDEINKIIDFNKKEQVRLEKELLKEQVKEMLEMKKSRYGRG